MPDRPAVVRHDCSVDRPRLCSAMFIRVQVMFIHVQVNRCELQVIPVQL